MLAENKLTKISSSDWPTLRDLHLTNWPKHISAYYAIDNYINWCQINAKIKNSIRFYCLNDDWSDGTFFIIDGILLYLNTLNLSTERLKISLDLLNWSNGYVLYGFQRRLGDAVKEVLNKKKLQIIVDHVMYTLHLTREKGLKLIVRHPPGVTMKPLSTEYAEFANNIWPHKCNGSENVVKNVIEMNISKGFFNEDNELLGFMLRFQGPIGNLYVNEKYRSKGLGKELIKAVCKEIAVNGDDSFCHVVKDNEISLKALQKTGFVISDEIQFIVTAPKARL